MNKKWSSGKQTAGGIDVPEGLVLNYSTEIPLYPEYSIPSYPSQDKCNPQLPSAIDIKLEFIKHMQQSAFYLQKPIKNKNEIKRYSDRFKPSRTKKSLSTIPTLLDYFPLELHSVKDASKSTIVKKIITKTINLNTFDELEKLESLDKEKKEEEEEEEVDKEYDEEQDEEEGDYQMDYYDEEMDVIEGGESDGGNNDDY